MIQLQLPQSEGQPTRPFLSIGKFLNTLDKIFDIIRHACENTLARQKRTQRAFELYCEAEEQAYILQKARSKAEKCLYEMFSLYNMEQRFEKNVDMEQYLEEENNISIWGALMDFEQCVIDTELLNKLR